MFFITRNLLVFDGNRQQSNARAGQKKNTCFLGGNALPKSNARAHLKQREKHSGLMLVWATQCRTYIIILTAELYRPYWKLPNQTLIMVIVNFLFFKFIFFRLFQQRCQLKKVAG